MKHLPLILFTFIFPTVLSYFFYESMLIDFFYVIDGYKIDAYVVKSEDDPYCKAYKIELVDENGESYVFSGWYGKQTQKYQKLNTLGAHNIVMRSRFLNKWGYSKRGEWEFIRFLYEISLLGMIIFFYAGFFTFTKSLIQGKPLPE